jgi:hypothetical protein
LAEPAKPVELAPIVAAPPKGMKLSNELADRFERLSSRLRGEAFDSLTESLARGDRLDLLMAGFLSGYSSARKS